MDMGQVGNSENHETKPPFAVDEIIGTIRIQYGGFLDCISNDIIF